MSDLSKRLREELIVTDDHNIVTAPLCAQAADALDAKDAEIARLREALEDIAAFDESPCDRSPEAVDGGFDHPPCARRARQALS